MKLYEVLKNNSGIKDSVPVKFSAGWILRFLKPVFLKLFCLTSANDIQST